MNILELIKEYESRYPFYAELTEKLKKLFENLLKENNANYLQVEARVKTIDSFLEKAQRLNRNYQDPINEIKDIVGLRVITYYREDVEQIGKIIEKEFNIVIKSSLYDCDHLSPDRFGYLSTHYKASISKKISRLSDWRKFKDFVFEIQLRTVVQHAWASIDHILRYKNTREIPVSIKRKLFRLSALFEIADNEFSDIKRILGCKEKKYLKKYKNGNLNIKINSMSLELYLKNKKQLIKSLENSAEKAGFKKLDFSPEVKPLQHLLFLFEKLGINTIKELDDLFQEAIQKSSQIFNILHSNISFDDFKFSSSSILLFFILILRATREDLQDINIDDKLKKSILQVHKNL